MQDEEVALVTTLRSDLSHLECHDEHLASKANCPVLPLAIEASAIIAAMDRAQKTQNSDIAEQILLDRLDAIKAEASYLSPRSSDGASFQIVMACSLADLLFSSDYGSDHQRQQDERLCKRLIEAAAGYLNKSFIDGRAWKRAREYFHSEYALQRTILIERLAEAG
jgi:hypothetical protein